MVWGKVGSWVPYPYLVSSSSKEDPYRARAKQVGFGAGWRDKHFEGYI